MRGNRRNEWSTLKEKDVTDEQPRAKPPNFLEIHAANHPDKMAVVGLDRTLTYGQLREPL